MITVVLPVHNGGRHLRECLESLARQDAPPGSFDVVILDNHSTDGSLEALRLLPDGIPRRVYESDHFLEIEQNWARIRELQCMRDFITIIGHDDALDPHFIRTMSQVLSSDPQTRLLLPHFRLIDQESRSIRPCRPMGSSESPAQFLASRLAGIRDSFGTGYVFRFDDYLAIGGIPLYAKLMYADDVLWMKLARRSQIRIIEDECFSYRLHPSSTQNVRDAQLIFSAFSDYLRFLEEASVEDPAIARVMRTYGTHYLREIAQFWLLEETNRANRARRSARTTITEGWRRILELSFSLVEQPIGADPDELAFSLWANETPVRQRLWTNRPIRRLLRTARRKNLIR
jgi:glycosyltransferase involved in cell wall biosynthesis